MNSFAPSVLIPPSSWLYKVNINAAQKKDALTLSTVACDEKGKVVNIASKVQHYDSPFAAKMNALDWASSYAL